MPLYFLVVEGPDRGKSFPIEMGSTVLIGRGTLATARLTDLTVSRQHCRVQWQSDEPYLIDEGGAGGTKVDGKPVIRYLLRSGDQFQIGKTVLQYSTELTQEITKSRKPAPERPTVRVHELAGRQIGRYRLDQLIHSSPTSTVFKAHDLEGGSPAAFKVLAPDLARSDEQKDRFVRAMKTMLPIQHPHIVRLYQAGKHGPFCWAAMEFIHGQNLSALARAAGARLPWTDVWKIGLEMSLALGAAAEHKIVHRNITPTNILRRQSDGLCLLSDLMLAKALAGAQSHPITRPGQFIGEAAYLAPERVADQTRVDGRADIYSLGATLYELLAGRPPFVSEMLPELMHQIRNIPCAPLIPMGVQVPRPFEALIQKMLEKDPARRPETPEQLRRELERVGMQKSPG